MGKKVKTNGGGQSSTSYKLSVVSAQEDKSSNSNCIQVPLLVDDVSFATCEKEFQLFRNKQARKGGQLQLAAESDRIKYEAVNFGKYSAATLPYRYALAVLDTEGHTASIFEPEVFVCNRIIKKQRGDEQAVVDEEQQPPFATTATSEYVKSRMLLGESFGTKKTKQMLSSLDRNKINMDQLATQSAFISRNIDSSINRMTSEEHQHISSANVPLAAIHAGDSEQSLLPPHDAKTKNVAEIYKMQDLIPHDVYYSMNVDKVVAALKAKNSEELATAMAPYAMEEALECRFKALASMAVLPEKTLLTHTVRCLVYLNYLLHFRALNEAKINGNLSALLPMATEEVVSALPRLFTESVMATNGKGRFKLSSLVKDRLIVHICILMLVLDGFRTNVARLSVALRLPATKVVECMKVVGCTMERPEGNEPTKFTVPGSTREIQVKMAILRAPLSIAPPKIRKGPPNRK